MKEEGKKKKIVGKVLKFGIPLVVSIGLCYVLFTDLDYRQMLVIIRTECNFWWIVAAMCVSILSFVCRAFRWRLQLEALDVHAPIHALIYSIFGTYAVNIVFPRLGEVWRTGYIAQRQKAPFTTVFGSMVADRLADTLTVLLLALVAFLLASNVILDYLSQNMESYQAIRSVMVSPWVWLTMAVLASALWIFMSRHSSNPWILKVQQAIRELWQGFVVVLRMPRRGQWLLWTVGIWGCFFLQMVLCFQAFPFTAAVSSGYGLTAVLVTFVLASTSMGVPSNGGIGPWQWAVIFALNIYGVDQTHGAAFANLTLGSQTLMLILLGIVTFILITIDKKKVSQLFNMNKR